MQIKRISHQLIGKPRRIGSLCIKECKFEKLLINRKNEHKAFQEMPFGQFLYVISKGYRHWQQSIWLTHEDLEDLHKLLENVEELPFEDEQWG